MKGLTGPAMQQAKQMAAANTGASLWRPELVLQGYRDRDSDAEL